MRKFVVSTIINCNLYPTMDVVMADDIHRLWMMMRIQQKR